MRKIVVDASAALAWLFEEESEFAKLKSLLDRSALVAPWLWRLEVTNAVLVRERRKKLSVLQASRLLQLVDELTIEFHGEPVGRTVSGLAQIARPHQLSSYDATYLDLASRLGLPLLTRDTNLYRAASRVGVELVDLG